ncbi:signal transduction histidine kinase [Fluviicoccus keumensis]|uniref:Sensory/regulatory protein RpfC n=1 Tax=Fluviicoccus keumensis TaxID=1435465 RepID=A0A4V2G618_9GAMM|nr:hybrid sensor histidine kinase/response regulator [Fluviicoccus keumensis]RZU46906.1 signal transduction histidine kinase [Fluviicoccus keumensis]
MSEAATITIIRLLLLLWALSAEVVFASFAPPLQLSSSTGKMPVSGHIAYVREHGPWQPSDVMQLAPSQWTPDRGTPNFGFTTQAYWFRIDVHSRDATDGILAILYPALDHVRVYETAADGRMLAAYRFGDMQQDVVTALPNRYFLSPVRLAAGESRIFLIRVETEGSLQLPLTYYDRQHFYDREQKNLLVEGIYFGILLIMSIYNLFIFTMLRDRSYAWYSAFVFTILVFQVSLSGFGFQFLWPGLPGINGFIIPLTMSGCLFTGAMFSLRFLDAAESHPRVMGVFRLTAATGFAVMTLSIIGSYEVAVRAAVITCGMLAVYAIWAGFYLWYRGLHHARYYAIAWFFLMPTIAILSLNKQGFLPVNFFTEYAIQIGSVLEAALFSFALGDRISLERRAKILAQEHLIRQERTLREELQRSHFQELQAQQKVVAAEAESRAKSQFLATMSHEIRTPLNGILGMIELLQGSDLQPHQRTYTEVISQSGQTLLSVINDILDYSKITAGKMQIENMDFDLEQLCMECASVFAFTAEKKHIELLAFNDADVPVFIQSDPTRIRQILLNLLGNAFKFTERGRVTLRVSLEREDEHSYIRFAISDTGIGVQPDQKERLFESFAQADSSMTRRFGGTGLGLAISKKLSGLLGGGIGVESSPGEGSLFWFRVRYTPADPVLYHHLRRSQQVFNGKHLLVVDDSPAFTQVIAMHARQWGMKVTEAFSGEQALACLETALREGNPPDVVTLDMRMPGMSGLECASAMEADERFRNIPRILLTAMQPAPSAGELEAAGVRFYQQKPVSGRGLSDLLHEVFELRQSVEAESAPALLQAAASQFAGKHVLVADDNEVNLTVITALLKKLGVHVVQALDGEQAAEYVYQHHADIDLILMDCEMPVMDGFVATRRIRHFEAERMLTPVPIVALTAHALPEYQQRCLEGGMDDYIAKPIQLRVLSSVLGHCWEGR